MKNLALTIATLAATSFAVQALAAPAQLYVDTAPGASHRTITVETPATPDTLLISGKVYQKAGENLWVRHQLVVDDDMLAAEPGRVFQIDTWAQFNESGTLVAWESCPPTLEDYCQLSRTEYRRLTPNQDQADRLRAIARLPHLANFRPEDDRRTRPDWIQVAVDREHLTLHVLNSDGTEATLETDPISLRTWTGDGVRVVIRDDGSIELERRWRERARWIRK